MGMCSQSAAAEAAPTLWSDFHLSKLNGDRHDHFHLPGVMERRYEDTSCSQLSVLVQVLEAAVAFEVLALAFASIDIVEIARRAKCVADAAAASATRGVSSEKGYSSGILHGLLGLRVALLHHSVHDSNHCYTVDPCHYS
jgi:hypothetical protein